MEDVGVRQGRHERRTRRTVVVLGESNSDAGAFGSDLSAEAFTTQNFSCTRSASLASFLVSVGTNPKVVQGWLRHSDVHTMLQLYSQSVSADRLAAQGAMLDAMGVRPELVN